MEEAPGLRIYCSVLPPTECNLIRERDFGASSGDDLLGHGADALLSLFPFEFLTYWLPEFWSVEVQEVCLRCVAFDH